MHAAVQSWLNLIMLYSLHWTEPTQHYQVGCGRGVCWGLWLNLLQLEWNNNNYILWLYQIFIWITWQGALCSHPSVRRSVQIPTMDDCRRQARNEDEHTRWRRWLRGSPHTKFWFYLFRIFHWQRSRPSSISLCLSVVLHADSYTRTHAHTHTRTRTTDICVCHWESC